MKGGDFSTEGVGERHTADVSAVTDITQQVTEARLAAAADAFAQLAAAGFHERAVTLWYGVPLVSDARYVPPPPSRPRRGLGGAIALLVAGEDVAEDGLGVLPAPARAALIDLGLVERVGERLRARVAVLPLRGLLLVSDRLDATADDAVGAPDLSALNLVACLPPLPPGARALDVGCGAGVAALLLARAGAEATGSDVDAGALALARLNARLNGVAARFVEADLFDGAPAEHHALVAFNAPLLRAPLFSDGNAPARYLTTARGEALALDFLGGLASRLAPDGEALLHAQLTAAVDARLDELAARAQVVSLRFAHAPDGTPHALTCIRPSGPTGRRQVRVPLGPACPHLRREILDAALAPRALRPDATPLAAPWLELHSSRVFAQPGAPTLRALTFGSHAIDDADLRLLESLVGAPLAALDVDAERLTRLVDLGLVLLR
jgi:methylase of polypeptide subunit release factors